MKTYIAGPMTHYPDLNKAAFNAAAERLKALGREVFNPVNNGLTDEHPWEEHMRADIAMLMQCQCIHLLPGWENSKGAALEHHIALSLRMHIEYPGTGRHNL